MKRTKLPVVAQPKRTYLSCPISNKVLRSASALQAKPCKTHGDDYENLGTSNAKDDISSPLNCLVASLRFVSGCAEEPPRSTAQTRL